MSYVEECAGPPDDIERPEACHGEVILPHEPDVIPGPPYGLVCKECSRAADCPPDMLRRFINQAGGEH